MVRIPLHSLVLDFAGVAKDHVHEYEIILPEKVEFDLLGPGGGYFNSTEILQEIKLKIQNKLWVGERVIVDARKLKKYEREQITNIVVEYDISIFYIVENSNTDRDIVRGDNKAQVVSISKSSDLEFVNKISDLNQDMILHTFKGITVVGDVHGQLEPMLSVIDWARTRNNFIIFLGDIIDFGPNSLECIEKAYDIVVRNKGLVILGNHERKIYKWLNKLNNKFIKLYISEANRRTIEKIRALTPSEKRKWEVKFRTIINLSKTHFYFNDLFFVHAAFSSEMLNHKNQRILPANLEKIALFGCMEENADREADTPPKLDYSWTDNVPTDLQVFVGHEVRSNIKPLITDSADGGRVYFMDTGSGKEGHLTSADIQFDTDGKSLVQNFNNW